VVNLPEITCSYRVWQGLDIPCKHAIAYIISILGAKLDYHVTSLSINSELHMKVLSLLFPTRPCGPKQLMSSNPQEIGGKIG
jgi:hypothetical protein